MSCFTPDDVTDWERCERCGEQTRPDELNEIDLCEGCVEDLNEEKAAENH